MLKLMNTLQQNMKICSLENKIKTIASHPVQIPHPNFLINNFDFLGLDFDSMFLCQLQCHGLVVEKHTGGDGANLIEQVTYSTIALDLS